MTSMAIIYDQVASRLTQAKHSSLYYCTQHCNYDTCYITIIV